MLVFKGGATVDHWTLESPWYSWLKGAPPGTFVTQAAASQKKNKPLNTWRDFLETFPVEQYRRWRSCGCCKFHVEYLGLTGTWDWIFSGKSVGYISMAKLHHPEKSLWFFKVADLSPIHFRKQAATDGTYGSKYWFPGFGGLIQGQIYNSVFGSFTCIFMTYADRVIGSDFIR